MQDNKPVHRQLESNASYSTKLTLSICYSNTDTTPASNLLNSRTQQNNTYRSILVLLSRLVRRPEEGGLGFALRKPRLHVSPHHLA